MKAPEKNTETSGRPRFSAGAISFILTFCLLLAGLVFVMSGFRRSRSEDISRTSPDSPALADSQLEEASDWLGLDAIREILGQDGGDTSSSPVQSSPSSTESSPAEYSTGSASVAASGAQVDEPQESGAQTAASQEAASQISGAQTDEPQDSGAQTAASQEAASQISGAQTDEPQDSGAQAATSQASESLTSAEASAAGKTDADTLADPSKEGTDSHSTGSSRDETESKASESSKGETDSKASESSKDEKDSKTSESSKDEKDSLTKLQKKYVKAWEDFHGRTFPLNAPLHNYNWKYLSYDEKGILHYKGDENYTIRRGIDVSEFQGQIDWDKVKKAGIDFVFVRAGHRTFHTGDLQKDTRAVKNLRRAKKAGLEVGVYVFSQAVSKKEAREEAQLCLDVIEESGVEITLPVAFDPEIQIEYYARLNDISGKQFTDNTVAFCEEIKKAGYTPAVYANSSTETDILDMSRLKDIVIWYADYNSTPDSPYDFTFWQYTNLGWVDGIPETETDLNVWFVEKSSDS